MGFYDSLKKLTEKIWTKNIIMITGNVDNFIYVDKIQDEKMKFNKDIVQIHEYLAEYLSSNNYVRISYYNNSSAVLRYDRETHKFDLSDIDNNAGGKEQLPNYLNMITDTINSFKKDESFNETKKAFIIDFSDIVMSNANQEVTYSKIAQLLADFSTFYSKDLNDYIKFLPKLIIITRKANRINPIVEEKNIEMIQYLLPTEDNKEREEIIRRISMFFQLTNSIDINDRKKLNEIISITDGLTFRELMQMAKLSLKKEFKDFIELYRSVTFDKKESEWEKFNKERIKELKEFLSKRVMGQDEAIKQVEQTMVRSYVGLTGAAQSSNSKKPKGILFFAGPTGTGKTELAKSLAEFVFGDPSKFIRFDMSEYNHEESDQKLIGAPPGYIGYESGGQLTNAIKEKPFSIILFDEIEKAHGKILDKFLQILEDGRLTSSKGEIIDFSETFIIFTSNKGASEISASGDKEMVRKQFIDAVKKYFNSELKRPEILNRIGIKNIVPFNFITDEAIIKSIIVHKLKSLKNKIKEEKNINLEIDFNNNIDLNNLYEQIKKGFDPKLGGRGLVTELESVFIDPLVHFIFNNVDFSNQSKEITTIVCKINKEDIGFSLVK